MALRRLPDPSSAPSLLARAEASGLLEGSERLLLWRDESGTLHADLCSQGRLERAEMSLSDAADAAVAASERRGWCDCGGVVAAGPVRRLWRLARLWQMVDGDLPSAGSWLEVAALVEVLRPLLVGPAPQATGVWCSGVEDAGELVGAALSALAESVLAAAGALDVGDLLQTLAVPAVKVRVSPEEGESLAAWGRSCSLSRAADLLEIHARDARDRRGRYVRFDEEAGRQLSLSGAPVLVDLGEAGTFAPCGGGGGAEFGRVLADAPVPVVLLAAAGLVEVAGGRMWGHLPPLAGEGLARSLRLPTGSVAASDCSCRETLVTLGRLTSVLVEPLALDARLALATSAL